MMKPMTVALTLLLLPLTACGSYWNHFGDEARLYEGADTNEAQLVEIDQGSGCATCVRSIKDLDTGREIYRAPDESSASIFDYPNIMKVKPGSYEIVLAYRGYKARPVRVRGEVELKAASSYNVLKDVCYGFCFTMDSYLSYVWLEDANTGQVLLGRKNGRS